MIRPEIFSHGKARDWLRKKLGDTRNHIGLSDGTSIKIIEGLENHVFFYELGERRRSAALQNLLAWSPEIFVHIRSQINSFQGVSLGGQLLQPPTIVSLPKSPCPGVFSGFYEFLLHPQFLEEGARFVTEKGAVEDPIPGDAKELIYIPFTEASTCDADFSRIVAEVIVAAYFNPAQCVLLRLPGINDNIPDLPAQIVATVEAIRRTGVIMPRVPARNVFLVNSDLPESFFHAHRRVSFILDETFDFWRYTREFYRNLHNVRYVLSGDQRRLRGVGQGLTKVLGRRPNGQRTVAGVAPMLLSWSKSKKRGARKNGH
jgi:hypothetical protein